MTVKHVTNWPFTFGTREHSGWLPPGAATPLPTPVVRLLLDVSIEREDGAYLLVAQPSSSHESGLPGCGDTWHQTIEEAEETARQLFGIESHHWGDCTTMR